MKKAAAALLAIVLATCTAAGAAGCSPSQGNASANGASAANSANGASASNAASAPETTASSQVIATVTRNAEFGHADVPITPEAMTAAGFSFGDSVDMRFSNGVTYEDVPYFNGYYGKTDELILLNYPNTTNLRATFCNGPSLWDAAGLRDGDTVTITLREKGKYLAVQEALAMSYSNDRAKFSSDEEFANFRAISGGMMKQNTFYRGASPVNNEFNRAKTAESLIEKAGVKFVFDLADTEASLASYQTSDDFSAPLFMSLYSNQSVFLAGMNMAYRTPDFASQAVAGLRQLISNEGPYYIHCTEGKDRTGMVCILLECVAGFSYDELKADYMKTYENYYGVTETSDSTKYDAIVDGKFNDIVLWLAGVGTEAEARTVDMAAKAHDYLIAGGMTESEYQTLVALVRA